MRVPSRAGRTSPALPTPHLAPITLVALAWLGLRARRLRSLLAGLGIAVGVAAMLTVVGISLSSSAQVAAQLERLGTNLLRVSPADNLDGQATVLPTESTAMIRRIPPVRSVAATGPLGVSPYRNPFLPSGRTNGLTVVAADPNLLSTVGGRLASGVWLDRTDPALPVAVLGWTASRRLGVSGPGQRIWLGLPTSTPAVPRGVWASVVGILEPVELTPELDTSVILSPRVASVVFAYAGHPDTVYVRTTDEAVLAVAEVLPRTAKPQMPGEVRVARPSDAIAAREATGAAFSGLLLGLGGVALVVGGIGVGNVMVITVLERRAEIGLRRALGATRGQILGQFLTEALLLSFLGGLGGVGAAGAITAAYATHRGWPLALPWWAVAAALAVTVLIGVAAGLYPAIRASRLHPTEALTAV